MKTLKVDEKWLVEYDPENNDRPKRWLRYGEPVGLFSENNPVHAMFYALLAREQSQ